MKKNQPKVLRAWTFYDWANSVYSLTITTAIFPLYYQAATKSAFNGQIVDFFGWKVDNDSLYSYTLSASFLIVALLSPILSGIADYTNRKKAFMQFFVYLGSSACVGMAFFEGSNIEYGMACSLLASVGFAGSIVFYNAYLPEIATPDRHDRLSARGFAMGYIGSVILLIINLIPIIKPDLFYDVSAKVSAIRQAMPELSEAAALAKAKGYFDGLSSKFAFVSVGLWWAGFSQIAFFYLPSASWVKTGSGAVVLQGYRELYKVWQQLQKMRTTRIFLLAFLSYNAGVQTIMYLATTFAQDEEEIKLGFATEELILITLIIQLVAIGGAYLFSRISESRGNAFALTIMIGIWLGVCIAAYLLDQKWQFYAIAGVVGFVMGGVQSTSRATYAKLVPQDTQDPASFFSFYDVIEKSSTVAGTLVFGLAKDLTGSLRLSALVLAVFFIVGGVLLHYAKIPYPKRA